MSKLIVTVDGQEFTVELTLLPSDQTRLAVQVNDETIYLEAPDLYAQPHEVTWFIVDGRPYEVTADANLEWLRSPWGIHPLTVEDCSAPQVRPSLKDGRVKAPIPGRIQAVRVAVGEEVEAGQPLLVLEAMKMENEIRAPRRGHVKEIHVVPGQSVALGDLLLEIE